MSTQPERDGGSTRLRTHLFGFASRLLRVFEYAAVQSAQREVAVLIVVNHVRRRPRRLLGLARLTACKATKQPTRETAVV